ncbi:twin-arginine translocation signal domain-containing protein [Candidatus Shapirobacteria bacterium]|nr:twin-arginine translocation signal domain-containing protein [Candidatus Shapirobacteria bacterium]
MGGSNSSEREGEPKVIQQPLPRQLSRREFLRLSAVMAAGGVAGILGASSAKADPGAPTTDLGEINSLKRQLREERGQRVKLQETLQQQAEVRRAAAEEQEELRKRAKEARREAARRREIEKRTVRFSEFWGFDTHEVGTQWLYNGPRNNQFVFMREPDERALDGSPVLALRMTEVPTYQWNFQGNSAFRFLVRVSKTPGGRYLHGYSIERFVPAGLNELGAFKGRAFYPPFGYMTEDGGNMVSFMVAPWDGCEVPYFHYGEYLNGPTETGPWDVAETWGMRMTKLTEETVRQGMGDYGGVVQPDDVQIMWWECGPQIEQYWIYRNWEVWIFRPGVGPIVFESVKGPGLSIFSYEQLASGKGPAWPERIPQKYLVNPDGSPVPTSDYLWLERVIPPK